MAFLGIGKKKRVVPDELPDLISDEIEKESNKELGSFLKEEEAKKESEVTPKEKVGESSKNTREAINRRKEVIDRLIKGTEKEEPIRDSHYDKSFFNDLQDNLTKEISDLDNLEDYYNKKFSSGSVLDDMKSYWKKQKTASVLDSMSQGFQEKISEKTAKLQKLEREWQKVYFELIEKEEEIKDEEKELKETLKEFVKVCKHRKNSLEVENRIKISGGNDEEKNKNKNKKKKKNKYKK